MTEQLDTWPDTGELVPVTVGDETVYLSVWPVGGGSGAGVEREIAARRPTLDDVIGGLAAFVDGLSTKLRETGASKVSVEFGCEVAVESGTFVAVIGKASAKSTFKVGMEWAKPTA